MPQALMLVTIYEKTFKEVPPQGRKFSLVFCCRPRDGMEKLPPSIGPAMNPSRGSMCRSCAKKNPPSAGLPGVRMRDLLLSNSLIQLFKLKRKCKERKVHIYMIACFHAIEAIGRILSFTCKTNGFSQQALNKIGTSPLISSISHESSTPVTNGRPLVLGSRNSAFHQKLLRKQSSVRET